MPCMLFTPTKGAEKSKTTARHQLVEDKDKNDVSIEARVHGLS